MQDLIEFGLLADSEIHKKYNLQLVGLKFNFEGSN